MISELESTWKEEAARRFPVEFTKITLTGLRTDLLSLEILSRKKGC
jgi:hypothetical protein